MQCIVIIIGIGTGVLHKISVCDSNDYTPFVSTWFYVSSFALQQSFGTAHPVQWMGATGCMMKGSVFGLWQRETASRLFLETTWAYYPVHTLGFIPHRQCKHSMKLISHLKLRKHGATPLLCHIAFMVWC